MTEEQLKQFHEVRKQYLRDLSKLRAAYLRKFLAVLAPTKR